MWPNYYCGRNGDDFFNVAEMVCGRKGTVAETEMDVAEMVMSSYVWPKWSVAENVGGRNGCGRNGLWPIW